MPRLGTGLRKIRSMAFQSCYFRAMELRRDAIYYQQLARVARLKASTCGDADLARRLREAAILHERKARQLERDEKHDGPSRD
jgi:hypothetical protein